MSNFLTEYLSELRDFPRTERFRSLDQTYWMKPSVIRRDIRPLWDLRRESLKWNTELSNSEGADCQIVEDVQIILLQRQMFSSDSYFFPRNFRSMDQDKALLVMDRWLRGIPLTPPVIVFLKEKNVWGKRDGFHRMAIAMMCLSPTIPVWVLGPSTGLPL